MECWRIIAKIDFWWIVFDSNHLLQFLSSLILSDWLANKILLQSNCIKTLLFSSQLQRHCTRLYFNLFLCLQWFLIQWIFYTHHNIFQRSLHETFGYYNPSATTALQFVQWSHFLKKVAGEARLNIGLLLYVFPIWETPAFVDE